MRLPLLLCLALCATCWGADQSATDRAKEAAAKKQADDDREQRRIDAQEAREESVRLRARQEEAAIKQGLKDQRAALIANLQMAIELPAGSKRESVNAFPSNMQGEWWLLADDGKMTDAFTVADEPVRIDVANPRMNLRFEHLYVTRNAEGGYATFEAYPWVGVGDAYLMKYANVLKFVYLPDGKYIMEVVVGPGNKVVSFNRYAVK